MDHHGSSWIIMDHHGSSWIIMDHHGCPPEALPRHSCAPNIRGIAHLRMNSSPGKDRKVGAPHVQDFSVFPKIIKHIINMCLMFNFYKFQCGLFAVVGTVLVNIQVSRTPVCSQGPSAVGDPAGCSKAEDPAHEIEGGCLWTNQNNLTLEMNGKTGNEMTD